MVNYQHCRLAAQGCFVGNDGKSWVVFVDALHSTDQNNIQLGLVVRLTESVLAQLID